MGASTLSAEQQRLAELRTEQARLRLASQTRNLTVAESIRLTTIVAEIDQIRTGYHVKHRL